jgi:hypothetical protein
MDFVEQCVQTLLLCLTGFALAPVTAGGTALQPALPPAQSQRVGADPDWSRSKLV